MTVPAARPWGDGGHMDTHGLTPGTIVVACDGSPHSDRAVQWAAGQAGREGRTLEVVHVVGADETRRAVWATAGAHPLQPVEDSALTAARTTIDEAVTAAQTIDQTLDVRGHVLPGDDPRDVLVEASHAAHLVVLGSRGRGPVKSLLLGSVSAAVTREAVCPVVVVRPRADGVEADRVGDGVVVGADGTAESLPVVEYAFRQASLRSMPLTVVHCYRDDVVGSGYAFAIPEIATEIEEMRVVVAETIAGMGEKFPDVVVTSELQRGLAEQVLTRHDAAWDLVVVGRRGRSTWDRLVVGSVGRAVLEHARTTVAVVPEAPDPSER